MKFFSLILRDKQQDPPAAFCDRCGGEQYACDTLYLLGGSRLCGQCVEDRLLAMTTAQKARLLGAETVPLAEDRPERRRECKASGPAGNSPGAPPHR